MSEHNVPESLLTVIGTNGRNKRGQYIWECICDCGGSTIASGFDLRSGHTLSCGCRVKKKLSEMRTKYNTYDLSGDYGVGYTFNGTKFYFDLSDYNSIKNYCWGTSHHYITAYDKVSGKQIRLHRLVMNCPDGLMVDHINHNKADNRKENLRIVTNQQNAMNHLLPSNNTSGAIGVSWSKKSKKWRARIGLNGCEFVLGYFKSFDEAVKARECAEKEYFGEYRYRQ